MAGPTDIRAQVRDFLVSRRNRLTPEAAGLPIYGGNRRVPGLRREEVALLSGLSVDYYVRLERGNLAGASESVLEALARALHLDDAERAHLYDLARASGPQRHRPRSTTTVRPTILRVLDAMTDVPAYVRNGRFDILGANQLGRALYAPVFDSPLFAQRGPVNTARFMFLDPNATDFWPDWDKGANDAVAFLRSEAGRSPHDRVLTDLIGELTTRSTEFSVRWARHDVKFHRTGIKRLRHPVVGELNLPYEALELAADPGLRLNVYTPEPDSPEQQALDLLASWTTELHESPLVRRPE
ncbi:helix-turn-helix transcriptional regulator [Micromonospora sp. R77]|uniref:helix-turn-helix transcriptional regulator n=1 Tax=Micromonospora sp. R77 TaxID=2925836 RepID=UPI001F614A66|nr:helix-turn-helix transcriptional regulator [Micromonospora sp. R77]MCI4063986.1 helix-turn-helix transcriptional regulator [Micromonospora sp. R77]